MKAILFCTLSAAVYLGPTLGGAAEKGPIDPGKHQDTNTLSSSNYPPRDTHSIILPGTNNLWQWTNRFTLGTNRFGGTNAMAFTNAQSWSYPSAWSSNHWWTNFTQFTNAIRAKWTNTSRQAFPSVKPAAPSAAFPTGAGQPQFLTDFKALVDKFEQDRQQMLNQMKSASANH